MKFRNQILFLGFLGLLMASLVGGIGLFNANLLTIAIDESQRMGLAMENSQEADMMHDVIWLSSRKLTFTTDKEAPIAIGLPHSIEPMVSTSNTSARRPYEHRRTAGDNSAPMSQLIVDSPVTSIIKSQIKDIAWTRSS